MADGVSGRILSGIGGFYYVETASGVVECRARGTFRRQGLSPLAGDFVRISLQGEGQGTVEEIAPRRNALIRPPVANLDLLVVVVSIVEPSPSTLVIDKLVAIAENKGIEPVVVINKSDLEDTRPLEEIYEKTGLPLFVVSAAARQGITPLREKLNGKVCAFTGNSGVGKSSLLNALDARLQLPTAQISQKLGRGRHTTRTSVLYPQPGGGYVVDTPGFSSLDFERLEWIPKEDLAHCFREFAPYIGLCKFTSCAHGKEAGCAVKAAVEQGVIARSRYESYLTMWEEVKDKKAWENR